MIKYLELALSQKVYEYLEELDEMNWSALGNVLNQYLRNTSIGMTVRACSYDPAYRDVSLTETNISVRSYGIFHPACRDEITL